MLRALVLVALGVVVGACDPLWSVRSAGVVHLHPDEQTIVDALRADEIVRSARVEDGHIYAQLKVPLLPGDQDDVTWINIVATREQTFELKLEFYVCGIGFGTPDGVPERWRPILDGLRDRVLARCSVQDWEVQSSELD